MKLAKLLHQLKQHSVHVYGKKYVGGMAGKKMGGRVEESYSKGKISADQFAGGLFGSVSKTSVLNSYSTMAVSGSSYLGGISALVDSSNVRGFKLLTQHYVELVENILSWSHVVKPFSRAIV